MNIFKSCKTLKDYILELIANKQDKLISGQNVKTINGTPIIGNGDITIINDALTALTSTWSSSKLSGLLNSKAPLVSPEFTGTLYTPSAKIPLLYGDYADGIKISSSIDSEYGLELSDNGEIVFNGSAASGSLFEDTPTEYSQKLLTSGAVKTALDKKVSFIQIDDFHGGLDVITDSGVYGVYEAGLGIGAHSLYFLIVDSYFLPRTREHFTSQTMINGEVPQIRTKIDDEGWSEWKSITYSIGDVSGLQSSLDKKADLDLAHTFTGVSSSNQINISNLENGKLYRAQTNTMTGIPFNAMFSGNGIKKYCGHFNVTTEGADFLFRVYKLETSLVGSYIYVLELIWMEEPSGPL